MSLSLLAGNAARSLARGLMRLYYPDIEVSHRERIPPEGAVLFVANHPNSMLDPPVIGWVARRPVHFFAKAPLFNVPVFGALMHALGMVPAYRAVDDQSQVRRNLDTLRAGAAYLAKGEAVGIFPEGKSHDLTRIEMIRSGAARLALQGAAAGGRVIIVPLGLNYERKERFRSAVWVRVGRALDALATLHECAGNERQAMRRITAEIESRLQEVAVHLHDPRWQPFLPELEILLPPAGEEAATPFACLRQRKLIADAMNHVLAVDRPRAEAIAAAIEAHCAQLAMAGLSLDSRIVRLQGASLAWKVTISALGLLLGLIPAVAGVIHHAAPFAITRLLVARVKQPGLQTVALNRLLLSLPIYAAGYTAVWFALATWIRPWVAWLWVAWMPLAGLFAWHYCRHLTQTARLCRQELHMLFRPARLRALRQEGAELRQRLRALAEDFRLHRHPGQSPAATDPAEIN